MKTFYLAVSLLLFVQCSEAVRACNTSTTFSCTSEPGKCIPNSWKCDGDIDCPNGEDEEKCSDTCPDDHFRCGNDQEKNSGAKAINGCIPKTWKCDGEFDCDDHSDEKNCPEIKCKEDQFKCSEFDGQFTLCIPNSWKCDGQNDCASGADEEGCHDRVCTDSDFKCRNGVCIFKSWTCDGEDDCGDGSDEEKEVCEKEQKTACKPGQMFRCKSGNGCIPNEWKCDGESDCRDHSDEEDCKVEKAASCHKTEFACKTGKFCISHQWKCDGEIDCPDGSDEDECDAMKCGATERSCSSENPKLPAATRCIPETFWCNGREDCANGEDEANCTKVETNKCGDYDYECPGPNALCIQRDKLCSTSNDNCFSDDFCSKNITDCTPGSNFCKKTDSYVKNVSIYQCAKGFKAVNGVCEDIDECKESGVCDQICQNLPGSYRCGCHRGYKLSQTKDGLIPTKCRALGGDPLVLLSNRATIRQFDIVTNVHQPLVKSPGSAVAMDFHLSNNTIIWSDITQQKILMCKVQNGNRSEEGRNSFILDGHDCNRSNQFVVFEGEVHTPDGLAIDWVHNLLFWTDGGLDQISVMNLDTRQKKVLFTDALEEPRAIAVDPEFGLIFWTDWGQEAKIERAGMDGKNRTVIMKGEQVKWPNGLALDLLEKRVYWADAKVKSILSCDYYGNNIKTVLHSHSYLRHPFSLAVFEDRVYFTDWEHDGVISVNKFTGGDVQKLMGKVSTPMTVRIYHKQAQPEHSNKCSNEGESPCAKERMCLPTGAIRGKDSTQEKPYGGHPFSCVCQGELGDGLEETAACLATAKNNQNVTETIPNGQAAKSPQTEVMAGNPGFSLSTMLLLAVLAIFVVGGYAFYRNRKGSSFTALNFDNPVYRRTVEPDMNDPFSDPFREEGTVIVSGPTQVEQPSRLVIHDEGENDRYAST